MALHYGKNVSLSSLSTFRMGGTASDMVRLDSPADLIKLFSGEAPAQWFILGGGSNIIFPDGDFKPLIIKLEPTSIFIDSEKDGRVEVMAGAGNSWDLLVDFAVNQGLSGIEALSAIPGSVGATPVQNVGAYGVEIKDVLVSARVFDTVEKTFRIFSNEACKFGYRDSIFKHEGKGRYIVTDITLALSRTAPQVPHYPGVADYFKEKGIMTPTLKEIRTAITEIRWKKLPDPEKVASVGSFFKNPIVSKEKAEALKKTYPSLAVFAVSETESKIGAGSLIDTAGFKGKQFGAISIYENNALVLVNDGKATRANVQEVVHLIRGAIQEKYGILLEVEPELL